MTRDMNTIDSNENWALIASDPAVFTDMIRQYGVHDTTVQELYSLDFETLGDPTDVHGLIFISPYLEEDLPAGFEKADPDADQIVFTAQVVTNVCATLALLAIIFNADIEKGRLLTEFLNFTYGFTPVNRGLCLGNSSAIRRIHDSYATIRHTADQLREDDGEEIDDDLEYVSVQDYHYVSYIYKNGYVWELDGLKSQPLKLAPSSESTWLEKLKPILLEKMNAGIECSMMAVKKEPFHSLIQQRNTYKFCLDMLRSYIDECNAISAAYEGKKSHSENTGAYTDIESYLAFDIEKENCYWKHREALHDRLAQGKPSPLVQDMHKLWDIFANYTDHAYESTAKPIIRRLKDEIKRLRDVLRLLAAEKTAQRKEAERLGCNYFPLIQEIIKAGYKEGFVGKRGLIKKKKLNAKQQEDSETIAAGSSSGKRGRGRGRGRPAVKGRSDGGGRVTKKR